MSRKPGEWFGFAVLDGNIFAGGCRPWRLVDVLTRRHPHRPLKFNSSILFFSIILLNHLKRRDRHFPIAWDLLIIHFLGHFGGWSRYSLLWLLDIVLLVAFRRRDGNSGSLSKKGYVKGNVKGKLGKTENPPDLWIHHDHSVITTVSGELAVTCISVFGTCSAP